MTGISYFRYALKDGFLIVLAMLQIITFIVMMFLFVRYIPWLTSHEMSELSIYESYTEQPPEWANSFSVNHGDFHFYRESPKKNRPKFFLIVGGLLVGWVLLVGSGVLAKKRIKHNAQLRQPNQPIKPTR